jgi:ubiquitin-conjugating enzyme E2 R
MSGETAAERWSPVQRVETVLISILSLLDDAEVSSPANVDAGVMLRNKPTEYKEMVKKDLELSKQEIPADFVMPTHETAWRKEKDEGDFDMSWEDSDAESLDFGGSESDPDEDQEMSDFEGDDDDAEEDEDMDDDEEQKKR